MDDPRTIDEFQPTELAPIPEEDDPEVIKIDAMARELVNNGFKENDAYMKVAGCTRKTACNRAKTYFRRPQVMARVKELVYGENATDLEQQYAKDIWHEWINITPLDYLDDHGKVLSPQRLKKLPFWVQRALKRLKITEKERTFKDGTVEVTRHYDIETVDKEAALQLLAKAHGWITEKTEVKHEVGKSLADMMSVANDRMMQGAKTIEREAIEGEVVDG